MPTADQLETELAERLRVAIAAGGGHPLHGGEAATTLVTRLEWLIEAVLRISDDWSRFAWVDGFTCDLHVLDERTAEAIGLLTWFDGDRWYVDPVLARVDLSATLPQIHEYEVRFGDAERGVGTIRLDARPPAEWPAVATWQVCVKGAGYPAQG